jgi:hypothetical protein
VIGAVAGVLLSDPVGAGLHPSALLALSLDGTALHAQDVGSLTVVTPSLQPWFGLRFELGFDFVFSDVSRR